MGIEAENGKIPSIQSNTSVVYWRLGEWQLEYGRSGEPPCTIARKGCAICSFAMAISYLLSKVYTPADVLSYIRQNWGDSDKFYVANIGTDTGSLVTTVAPTLGLKAKSILSNEIISELSKGHMVIMSSKYNSAHSGENDKLHWTNGKHIVLLSGLATGSSDRVICHNCSKPKFIGETYTISEIREVANNGWWSIYKEGLNINTLNSKAKLLFANGGIYTGGSSSEQSYLDYKLLKQDKPGGTYTWSSLDWSLDAIADWESTKGSYTWGYKGDIDIVDYHYEVEYYTVTKKYIGEVYKSALQKQDVLNTGLLTYPTLVESPFIHFKVNGYEFGTYTGSKFPNYIESMKIVKINGDVNKYTIQLRHQIEAGADPNLLDKIFSNAKYGSLVYISYGDYNAPSFTYKEELAILLKVQSQIDFRSSSVSYTVECTSTATSLYARKFNFPKVKDKPSDIIYDMLWGSGENVYGLKDVFPGMYGELTGKRSVFIASDDRDVDIPEKTNIDPLSYINYLTTCMCSMTSGNDVLKDSTYKFCMYDTNFDESDLGKNGPYFKVVKIPTSDNSNATLLNENIYEVDIGYPTDNMVMSFSVNTDNTWVILYDYADTIREVTYSMNDDGLLNTLYLPKVAVSNINGKMNEAQRTWWTNMTRYPISATLEIKGLVRPALLMSYIRINSLFYGQRHISSGLYIITSLEDSISGSGYRTTLGLLRIAGDDDYISTVEKEKTEGRTKLTLSNYSKASLDVYSSFGLSTMVASSGGGYHTSGGGSFSPRVSTNSSSISTRGTSEIGAIGSIGSYYSVYPACVALSIATGSTNIDVLAWAASAAMHRKLDVVDRGISLPTTFEEFVHSSKSLIQSYKKDDYGHENSQLYTKYNHLSTVKYQESKIFNDDAAYAYDAAVDAVRSWMYDEDPIEEVSIRNFVKYTTSKGYLKSAPTILPSAVSKVYDVIVNGRCVTNANYFSTQFYTLSCNGKSAPNGTDVVKNYRHVDSYWEVGKTALSDEKGIMGYFVGFPNNESDIPFIVLLSLLPPDTANYYGSGSNTNSDNWKLYAWDLCIKQGMTKKGAAALLGNLIHECANTGPTTVEYTFSNSLIKYKVNGWTSIDLVNKGITLMLDDPNSDMWTLNSAGDNLSTKFYKRRYWFTDSQSFTGTYWGYGLALWTSPIDRKLNLIKLARSKNKSVGDITTQIDFVILELNGDYLPVLNHLKSATDIDEATYYVLISYEGIDDGSLPSRLQYAHEAYSKFA